MRIAVLLTLMFATGCGAWIVKRPPGFEAAAQPVPIEHSFVGFSGTSLAGYVLDADLVASSGVTGFGSDTLDASTRFALRRGDAIAWAVKCLSRLDGEVRPTVRVVCVYLPADRAHAPLSLTLTASATAPLRGVFMSADGPWIVEGTMESEADLLFPDTAGLAVRRPGGPTRLFVDATGLRVAAEAARDLSAAELTALAPLVLAWAPARDPRLLLRNQHGSSAITFGGQGTVMGRVASVSETAALLPAVPAPFPGMTDHEAHAARVAQLGFSDAARALWAYLAALRTPVQ